MSNQGGIVIKASLLVTLATRVVGGVYSRRRNLDPSEAEIQSAPELAQVAKWETVKVVSDPESHAAASKARATANNRIRARCVRSPIGLLCPLSDRAALDAAITEAREAVRAHNALGGASRVGLYVLPLEITPENEAATTRAILSEVAEQMAAIQAAIQSCNPEAIRAAVAAANDLSAVLDDERAAQVTAAVAEARKAARTIVAEVVKGGKDSAAVLAGLQGAAIERARFEFRALSDDADDAEEAMLPPTAGAAVLDLGADEGTMTPDRANGEPDPTEADAIPEASGFAAFEVAALGALAVLDENTREMGGEGQYASPLMALPEEEAPDAPQGGTLDLFGRGV